MMLKLNLLGTKEIEIFSYFDKIFHLFCVMKWFKQKRKHSKYYNGGYYDDFVAL